LNSNFRLIIKCLLFKNNYLLIENKDNNYKNNSILISNKVLYYVTLHLRLSTMLYSTQLVDIFSYELPNNTRSDLNKNNSTIVVYNFNSFLNQDRFFIFCSNIKNSQVSKSLESNVTLNSISEVFSSANWLERENSELHGVNFSGKKDLRNLLLQYGDNSYPFQKSFPSIGLKEMFFNPIKDSLIQSNVSLQI
jgi:NADH:ubiquinone oxidoreductase subunit C